MIILQLLMKLKHFISCSAWLLSHQDDHWIISQIVTHLPKKSLIMVEMCFTFQKCKCWMCLTVHINKRSVKYMGFFFFFFFFLDKQAWQIWFQHFYLQFKYVTCAVHFQVFKMRSTHVQSVQIKHHNQTNTDVAEIVYIARTSEIESNYILKYGRSVLTCLHL